MQHCENCGSELRANARYCGHCGQKIRNETEVTTISNDAPIEDIPVSPLEDSTAFNNLQDSELENEEEEEQQPLDLASENDVVEEEETTHQALENDEEEEEQTQQDYIEPPGSMPGDTDSDQEILTNQLPDEQPQDTQTPMVTQETHGPYASAQKQETRPVSRCLLFFLVGLVVAGVVVALIGLFHLDLPGIGGSSHTQSSSSSDEIIKNTGSSLTASVCIKSSTPSTSTTNVNTGFTLFASSGCSSMIAASANSLCLIFPYNAGAAHKYILDVSNAAIDSKPYHLILGVAEYTGPTTYKDVQHISTGISEGATGNSFSWLYRSGSVTINNDERSGTVDMILQSASGGNTIHIVGNWVCGRQIKDTSSG